MKCPKCKYISFDYNERCPNCNNDLTRERKVFDLIAFKHNPPSLLESLTGDFADIESYLRAGSLSVDAGVQGKGLDLHLDKEDPYESLPEEEFSLDQEDLEGEIVISEDNALEMLDSGNISLNDTIQDLPAAQEIVPPPSSEISTTEIAFEELPYSEDQGA
jgi:hypothetical protein